MSVFTANELRYLREGRRLGRLATVGADGTPHVAPVGWSLGDDDTIVIAGIDLPSTKKYRDAARRGRAAIVVDDVLPPWQPRGVEIRGRAEVTPDPDARIVIHPARIVGWGLDGDGSTRNARTVGGDDRPDPARPAPQR